MSRSKPLTLLLLGLVSLAGPGCRSFQGNFLRRDVAQAPASRPEQFDREALVRTVALEHDRRAELIQSLKAELNLQIDTYRDPSGRDRSPFLGGTASGWLVMERPKNLRVTLRKPPGMAVADIGSNQREFWFANDLSNEMIVGTYAQTEGFSDPMLASVRPDWIFEVLGLEPLAQGLEIAPGESEATLTLVEQRRMGSGEVMVKEAILNVAEQRIVEHRLYTEGRKELIARARVERPETIKVGAATGPEPPPTIQIPRVVRLTVPNVAELTMYLGSMKPNPPDDFVANTTFDRPVKEGYLVVDVLELAGAQGVSLADQKPIPPPVLPPSRSAREDAPGSLTIPRSDRAISRAEEVAPSRGDGVGYRPISDRSSIALDLPSPPRSGAVEVRRSTWDSIEGHRFRRGALGGQ